MKKGWEIRRLGDLAEMVTKGTTPTSIGHEFTAQGINFVKVESISLTGQFIEQKFAHINPDCHEALKRSQLKAGDILFSIAGALGRTAIVSDEILPANTNQALAIIRLKFDASVFDQFVLLALQTGFAIEQIEKYKGGAAQQNLSLAQVRDFQIPIPPLAEQKRIVALLDEAFAGLATAQANAEKNLQNARALFESQLETVFSKRGEGWVEKRLETVCSDIFAGGDVPKQNHSKVESEKYRIPIYTNGEKNNGLYGFTDTSRVTTPSVTISARGTIGYAVLRNESYYPAIRLIVVIPRPDVLEVKFMYYSIKNAKFDHSGTSIPQLTVPMVRDFPIYFPSLSKQREIVAHLDALSAETQRVAKIYEQKQAALAALKKSLLHQAFSGEL